MKSTAGIKGGNQSFQTASLQGGQDDKRHSEIQLMKHEEGKHLNNIRGNVDVNDGSIVKTVREKRLRAERENWGTAEW